MRQYKFRAKSTNKSEWWEGFYVYSEYEDKHFIVQNAVHAPYHETSGAWCFAHFTEINPDTIGQYTGLKDSEGQEIYEGDIIVIPDTYPYYDQGVINYVGVVEMIFGCWQYVLHCVNPLKRGISDGINDIIDSDGDGGAKFKIIGNIHENKDLLTND